MEKCNHFSLKALIHKIKYVLQYIIYIITIVFIAYVVILAFYYIMYQISVVIEMTVSNDKLPYVNLSSSLLSFVVTTAYVVFTYRILKTTEENTKQSQMVVQHTTKAQKIAYLERRLEKFYLPLQNLLFENRPELLESNIQLKLSDKKLEYLGMDITPSQIEINTLLLHLAEKINSEFVQKYGALVPFNYLACKESSSLFGDLRKVIMDIHTDIVESMVKYRVGSAFTFNKENSIGEYNKVKLALESDIASLKAELTELVNQ